jgi:hypothetical protein
MLDRREREEPPGWPSQRRRVQVTLARSETSALWAINPEVRLKDYPQYSRPDPNAQLASPVVSRFATAATGLLASGGGFRVLPGQDAKRPGMGPPVVLGQDLAEAAGAIGHASASRGSKVRMTRRGVSIHVLTAGC